MVGPGCWRRRGRLAVAALVALSVPALGCSGDDGGRSAEPPAPEAGGGGSAEPIHELDLDAVDARIDAYVADNDLNGAALVVVHEDLGVVHEHYAGVFGPDRVSLVASASKMLTAGVLMALHDRGVLDVDAPVSEVVEWGAANPRIAPVHLISNSSGLRGLLQGPTYGPYICQYLAVGSLADCGARIFTTPEDDDDVVPPDTEFRYGGGQWQVAGAVAEAASGSSWADLVREIYVEPCGVDSLGYGNHYTQLVSDDGPFSYPPQFDGDPSVLAPTDNPNLEGGAYLSPRDYATLLLMHLRDGRCGDEQVLSPASVRRMHTDRVVDGYGAELGVGTGTEGGRVFGGYGLGWWVLADRPSVVEDAGAFGAVPWLDLERGYGAYLVVEATSRVGRQLAESIRDDIAAEIDRLA
jgi:CubicO group peptidase (beta-lactamase class C family)